MKSSSGAQGLYCSMIHRGYLFMNKRKPGTGLMKKGHKAKSLCGLISTKTSATMQYYT